MAVIMSTSMQMTTSMIISFSSWLAFKSESFLAISSRSLVICSLSIFSSIIVVCTNWDRSAGLIVTRSKMPSFYAGDVSYSSKEPFDSSPITSSRGSLSYSSNSSTCSSSLGSFPGKLILLSRLKASEPPGMNVLNWSRSSGPTYSSSSLSFVASSSTCSPVAL